MDSTVLYEKDGMKFTKIHDKKYSMDFFMENKNILLANVVNFDLIKLIYELNGDIYETVDIKNTSDNEATVVLVMKHLFEDLGLPQRYSYLHMTKIVNNNEIIFRSQSIYSERPENIPKDSELMALKESIGTCKIISPHKITFSFAVVFEDYVKIPQFAEKILHLIK